MGVPSKDVFESYFNDVNWSFDHELIELLGKDMEPISIENMKILFKEYEKKISRYMEIEWGHELNNYYWSEPSYIRACGSLWGKRKKIREVKQQNSDRNPYDVGEKIALDRLAWYVLLKEKSPNNLNRNVYGFLKLDQFRPNKGIYGAIYDYFYSDRCERLLDLINQLDTLDKAISRVEKLTDELKAVRECCNNLNIRFKADNGFRRQVKWLKARKKNIEIETLPVRRNDASVRERVLIYDLSKTFMKNFRKEKPSAIYHLLNIEGVINNLEQRSIERLLKGWREEKEKINISD